MAHDPLLDFPAPAEPDELQDALDLRAAEDDLAEAEAEFTANGGDLEAHAHELLDDLLGVHQDEEGNPTSPGHREDLAAGDHFAGMPDIEATPTCDICGEADGEGGPDWNGETGNHLSCEADLIERRQRVLNEITDDIESGNAHLMTRNELVEFMQWWLDQPNERNANEMLYQSLDQHEGKIVNDDAQIVAKAFFVEKGYEA